MVPETRYVQTHDGVHIAYQVVGEGPYDLVFQNGWLSNVDLSWETPLLSPFLRSLTERARLILFDRRGTGGSDRPAAIDTLALEKGVDDALAVLDAVGSKRCVFFGFEDGSILGLLLAASHPERVSGLAMFAPWVSYWRTDDYPWGNTEAEALEWEQMVQRAWGTEEFTRWNLGDIVASTLLEDPEFVRAWTRYWRLSASPASALAIEYMQRDVDVRAVLPSVRVPTIVMHRERDVNFYQGGRWIAEQIPGARFTRLPGSDHAPMIGDTKSVLAVLDRFTDGLRAEESDMDRVLATVLFTDIVGSTQRVAEIGDRRWGELQNKHQALVRDFLARYRGVEVDTAGDGFLATFDGPARAVRAAHAIVMGARSLGIEIRAGVHTGEVERSGSAIGGLAVHIGARVGALAAASEVLVSSTVRDLTAGSGLTFDDVGEHTLKGVADPWRLFRLAAEGDGF